jgi:hypothetical protein
MLYYQTIDSKTLELLKNLQELPTLSKMRLVGGTSLALQIGHRKSIDIDLFGELNVAYEVLLDELGSIGKLRPLNNSKNIHCFLIDDVKVDIVNYTYPWLSSQLEMDNLVLAKVEDISAMKLNAILGRGSKKDFIDLYFLLKQFSLKELVHFYNLKYKDGSEFLVLKSLVYFEDADVEEMPVMFDPINWEEIKRNIANHHAGLLN